MYCLIIVILLKNILCNIREEICFFLETLSISFKARMFLILFVTLYITQGLDSHLNRINNKIILLGKTFSFTPDEANVNDLAKACA